MRHDIHAADIEGVAAADGVLTASGGKIFRAAVVARQLNKVCLVNFATLRNDPDGNGCRIGGIRLAQGEELFLDGNSGNIYHGRIAVIRERPEVEHAEAETWRRDMTIAGGFRSAPAPLGASRHNFRCSGHSRSGDFRRQMPVDLSQRHAGNAVGQHLPYEAIELIPLFAAKPQDEPCRLHPIERPRSHICETSPRGEAARHRCHPRWADWW